MSVIGSQPSSHTLRFSEEDHDTQIGLLKLEEAGASLVGTGSGTTVVVGKKEDGSYVATYQVVVPNLPLATPENSGSRKEITYNIAGLIDVIGYLATTTNSYEIGVHLNALGAAVGTFYGSAKSGLVIDVTLRLVSGSVRFYLEEGALAGQKDLHVLYSLSSPNVTSAKTEGDEKIFGFSA